MSDLQILTYPAGKPINWKAPPKRDTRVSSNLICGDGTRFTGSMYVVAHMQWMMTRAPKALGYQIHIMQPPYNEGYAPSVGTHDFDYVWDIRPDRGFLSSDDGLKFQWWVRRHFAGGWFRHTGSWAAKLDWHVHGFPIPPDGMNFPTKVGEFVDGGLSQFGKLTTSSQILDYHRHAMGLKDQHIQNEDKSKFPKVIKGWDYDGYIAMKVKELG